MYEPRYENSRALVIGINAYSHTSPLEYARQDADAIAALLAEKFDFPEEDIALLQD